VVTVTLGFLDAAAAFGAGATMQDGAHDDARRTRTTSRVRRVTRRLVKTAAALRRLHVAATVLAALTVSCGGVSPTAAVAPSATPPAASAPANLTGTWKGTGVDSKGVTTVTWGLTQTGNTVSGTVATQAVDPTDGSCNSCHRNKTGTFSGTVSGTTMSVTMFFAAGVSGDPTPICSQTVTGNASSLADGTLATAYTGADSCEGAFADGRLTMARRP
jgi:hypothetical protein